MLISAKRTCICLLSCRREQIDGVHARVNCPAYLLIRHVCRREGLVYLRHGRTTVTTHRFKRACFAEHGQACSFSFLLDAAEEAWLGAMQEWTLALAPAHAVELQASCRLKIFRQPIGKSVLGLLDDTASLERRNVDMQCVCM